MGSMYKKSGPQEKSIRAYNSWVTMKWSGSHFIITNPDALMGKWKTHANSDPQWTNALLQAVERRNKNTNNTSCVDKYPTRVAFSLR